MGLFQKKQAHARDNIGKIEILRADSMNCLILNQIIISQALTDNPNQIPALHDTITTILCLSECIDNQKMLNIEHSFVAMFLTHFITFISREASAKDENVDIRIQIDLGAVMIFGSKYITNFLKMTKMSVMMSIINGC